MPICGVLGLTGTDRCLPSSPCSKVALDGLVFAVQALNRDITGQKRSEFIDVQTKYACLEESERKESATRYPDQVVVKRKRDAFWYKMKNALERFCKVLYAYSTVIDVLAP